MPGMSSSLLLPALPTVSGPVALLLPHCQVVSQFDPPISLLISLAHFNINNIPIQISTICHNPSLASRGVLALAACVNLKVHQLYSHHQSAQ